MGMRGVVVGWWGLEQDAVTMVIPLVGTSVHSYVHACRCPLTFPSLCVPPVVPSAPQEATTCTASDPPPHPQPPTPAPGMGMG